MTVTPEQAEKALQAFKDTMWRDGEIPAMQAAIEAALASQAQSGEIQAPPPQTHVDGITISQAEVKALLYGVPKFEFSQALTRLAAWLAEVDDTAPPPSPAPNLVGTVPCPTCNGTGKEGRHSICRDCDETTQSLGWKPISTMPREEGLIVEVRQEKIERWNAMRFLRHHGDEGWSWRPVASAEVEG